LFDYGDVDRTEDDVRIQHQQVVALHQGGGLLIADSYNDCIKLVNPETRSSTTWLRGLSEPGGLACTATHAYIADTNQHRIAVAELASGKTEELRLG
jgi:hypothetical protein